MPAVKTPKIFTVAVAGHAAGGGGFCAGSTLPMGIGPAEAVAHFLSLRALPQERSVAAGEPGYDYGYFERVCI